jgi:hypothetical protein
MTEPKLGKVEERRKVAKRLPWGRAVVGVRSLDTRSGTVTEIRYSASPGVFDSARKKRGLR